MDRPGVRGSQGENDAESAGFDDGREGLVVINPLGLRKATNNPTGFIASERAVRVVLVSKNPLPADDGSTGGPRNKRPSLVLKEGLVLVAKLLNLGRYDRYIGRYITFGALPI